MRLSIDWDSTSYARASGHKAWDACTPYELRTVGAFVRLGEPERAHAMLDFFREGRRPPRWNEWDEVVRKGYRTPGFIGDMPHTWVGSDFIRSALDLFAYDDEDRAQPDGVRVHVGGNAHAPAGGVVIRAPFPRRPRAARVNGAVAALQPDGSVLVHALPATVEFSY